MFPKYKRYRYPPYRITTEPLELAGPIYPGKIIPCSEPKKLNIPHWHIFSSDDGIVFNSTKRVVGLVCSCGSILLLDN